MLQFRNKATHLEIEHVLQVPIQVLTPPKLSANGALGYYGVKNGQWSRTKSISKVYERRGPRLNLKPRLKTFCPHLPNFYRRKRKKFGFNFRPQLPLPRCSAETDQCIRKLEVN